MSRYWPEIINVRWPEKRDPNVVFDLVLQLSEGECQQRMGEFPLWELAPDSRRISRTFVAKNFAEGGSGYCVDVLLVSSEKTWRVSKTWSYLFEIWRGGRVAQLYLVTLRVGLTYHFSVRIAWTLIFLVYYKPAFIREDVKSSGLRFLSGSMTICLMTPWVDIFGSVRNVLMILSSIFRSEFFQPGCPACWCGRWAPSGKMGANSFSICIYLDVIPLRTGIYIMIFICTLISKNSAGNCPDVLQKYSPSALVSIKIH